MDNPDLGAQELEVLRYVSDNAPLSVRETASGFGKDHGLARTTILTVMERLRRKGYLSREKRTSVFVYSPVIDKTDVLRDLVGDFVQRKLGGSLTPFVAYLAEARDLSESEKSELRRILDEG